MPLLADRVKEASATTGTGTINLGGAAAGFQSFASAFASGSSVYYTIAAGSEWEVGYGTYTTAVPDTLSRDAVLDSSNAGALVDFSTGAKDVFCTIPAAFLDTKADLDSPVFTGPVGGITSAMVGLGNVNDTSDVDKPVSTAQASADTAAENAAKAYADGLAGNYDAVGSASTAETNAKAYADGLAGNYDAVGSASTAETNAKAYADGLVVGLWDDRGAYDASVNTFPASGGSGTAGAVLKGDIWSVSVAGTLGGVAVGIGDTVRALADTPGQTASNWALQENNIGYVPENVANKVTSISGASTDTQYPSAKLAYDQLALKAPLNAPTFTGTVGGITAAMVGAPSGSGTSSGTNTGDQTPTSLGLVIGTNVQAYDADLTTWAGVTPGAGVATALAIAVGAAGSPVVNGGAGGTPSSLTLTNATGLPAAGVTGTALVASAIGTTVQAQDATLTSLALLGTAADKLAYTTGVDTWAETAFTAAARTVLDDATVSAMVDTLGGATSTGTGGLVRATSPAITDSLTSPSTSFALLATPTTVNAFAGASVALNIGNASVAAAFLGGISIPTGKNLTGAGTATVTGFATVSATTITGSGILSTTDATDATSATAASLKTAGGIASVKGLWIGTTSRLVGNVRIDSAIGIGAAAISSSGVYVAGALTTGGTTQSGVYSGVTVTTAATANAFGVDALVITPASAFTVTSAVALHARNAVLGSTSTITNLYGVLVDNQTQGSTLNVGFGSTVTSGTGKWNIYASGTAQNAFAGNVRIGSVTAPTVALDVTGAALISTTLGVTGALTTNGGLQTFGANDSGGAGYRQVLVPNV